MNLASAYLSKGNIELAEKEYKWVITKEPDNKKALYNLGIIYSDMKRKDEAVLMFERYLKLEPKGKSADKAREYLIKLKAKGKK
jgi:tetratricopeptide (TPR) repeat protein